MRQKLGEGANLYELSSNLPAYKNQVITEINGYLNKIVINGQDHFFQGISLKMTRMKSPSAGSTNPGNHFFLISKKKNSFLTRGIKVYYHCSSSTPLKNIEYIEEAGEQAPGEYAKIFEEEYNNAKNEFLDLFKQEYNEFLRESEPAKVHKGYLPTQYSDYLKRDDAGKVHDVAIFLSIKKGNLSTRP